MRVFALATALLLGACAGTPPPTAGPTPAPSGTANSAVPTYSSLSLKVDGKLVEVAAGGKRTLAEPNLMVNLGQSVGEPFPAGKGIISFLFSNAGDDAQVNAQTVIFTLALPTTTRVASYSAALAASSGSFTASATGGKADVAFTGEMKCFACDTAPTIQVEMAVKGLAYKL